MEGSHIDVDQAVDIWSLGGVFSEVAVWVVHGKHGLDAYRQRRQEETNDLPGFKDGRAFHNGQEVLQSVCITHDKVSENVRNSDHITRSIVKRMITEMLDEADSRPNSNQLWTKSQRILKDAEKKVNVPKEDISGTNVQYRRREPPILPPDLTQTQRHHSGRHDVPNRLPSYEHNMKGRSATIDLPGPVRTPSPKMFADVVCQTPDDMLSPTSTPPTSSPDIHVSNHKQYRDSSEHGNVSHHASLRQSASPYVSGWPHSPTQHGKAHQCDTMNNSSYMLDLSQDRSLARSVSGLNIGELGGSPDHSQAAAPPSRQIEAEDLQSQPAEKEAIDVTDPSPPLKNGVPRRPPYTSIAKAENWILKKQRGDTVRALEHTELLGDLKQRDHVRYTSSPEYHALLTISGIPRG